MVAALSAGRAILIGFAAGAAVVVLLFGFSAERRRRARPTPELDIPQSMRPGPSDPDLEKPLLERHIAVGALFVVIMAIWLPVVWVREPVTNRDDTKTILAESVERGRLTTMPGGEENQLGFNCERCHGPGLHGGQNFYNGGIVPVPDLTTVCGGEGYGHPLIKSLDDVINTIAQGREGTDMPSWSVRYAGAMNDLQIQDLINYILSIQREPASKNVCLNPPK
jgi:cytochrome c